MVWWLFELIASYHRKIQSMDPNHCAKDATATLNGEEHGAMKFTVVIWSTRVQVALVKVRMNHLTRTRGSCCCKTMGKRRKNAKQPESICIHTIHSLRIQNAYVSYIRPFHLNNPWNQETRSDRIVWVWRLYLCGQWHQRIFWCIIMDAYRCKGLHDTISQKQSDFHIKTTQTSGINSAPFLFSLGVGVGRWHHAPHLHLARTRWSCKVTKEETTSEPKFSFGWLKSTS